MELIRVSSGHTLWPDVSIFIRSTYLEHYCARLENLPENFVALVDAESKVLCAAGLRDARESFFSECYLDRPIESALSVLSGKRVERNEIAEVSSLASRAPAISIHFLRNLVLYGGALNFNWAFFTATNRLEKALRRIRLPLIDLGAANRDRVATPEIWGRYYDSAPKVFAIGGADLKSFLLQPCKSDFAHG